MIISICVFGGKNLDICLMDTIPRVVMAIQRSIIVSWFSLYSCGRLLMTSSTFTQFVKVVTPPTDFPGLIIFDKDFKNNYLYIILSCAKEMKRQMIVFAYKSRDGCRRTNVYFLFRNCVVKR